MQDAYILSHILGSSLTTKSTLRAALSAYQRVCLPRANKLIGLSAAQGRLVQFKDSDDCERMVRELLNGGKFLAEGEVETDLKESLAWLEGQLT